MVFLWGIVAERVSVVASTRRVSRLRMVHHSATAKRPALQRLRRPSRNSDWLYTVSTLPRRSPV